METFEEFRSRRESVISTWPLSSSIIPLLVIIAIYLIFSIKVGPLIMTRRKVFDLKYIVLGYNLAQVVFNGWMCYAIDLKRSLPYMVQSCYKEPDPDFEYKLIEISWWFLINKIVDFCDTLFIVLRKKNTQLNFLHLYHHPTTVFFAWFHLKYGPGVHTVFSWWMNSSIHVLMYSYYFLSGLGPQIRRYLWWKKYLTAVQILQFCGVLLYSGLIMIYCDYPKWIILLGAGNSLILLVLFLKFYLDVYQQQKQKM